MGDNKSALSRRQVLVRGGGAALGVGAASLLSACGGGGSGAAPSNGTTGATAGPSTDGTPVRGGTLTIGCINGGQSETLIPGRAVLNSDLWRGKQLFDGLYQIGSDRTPQPALAESAEPNADGTTWTVKIRGDVTWHDGKPLTAADVAESVKGWTNAGNFSSSLAKVRIDAERVRARGPLTVEIPFRFPVADFPGVVSLISFYIVRPDAYKKGTRPIGTGPFKYESFTP
ncbi:MAG TPA: ABC transporter substrate-binding protein, partial [Baekduia sp.]|nr:ABC transporter substrate-binding protein [Baekduia sp.]